MSFTIKFKKVVENAIIPKQGSEKASGYDLYSLEEFFIYPGQVKLVSTGISAKLCGDDDNFLYELQVRPRSGLALKTGITVLNTPGTIDEDYTGEIKVILINLGLKDFYVKKGDRIAKLVPCIVPKTKMEICDELETTKRGSGGFGHTGL